MHFLDIVDKTINITYAFLPRLKPQVSAEAVHIIAHRGAHNNKMNYKENTLQAFERACQLGCWGIEIDIQTTADNELVVLHDPCLNRLWHTDKLVKDLRLKELQQLVPDVPTLAEVVRQFGKKMHLFIELKHPFSAIEPLNACLNSLVEEQDYHIICLDEPLLNQLTAFSLPARLLVADAHNTNHFCQLSLDKKYGGVLGHFLLLSKKRVKKLSAAGQKVGVGFVDSKRSLYRELNRGIRWIFTNKAAKITQYLK